MDAAEAAAQDLRRSRVRAGLELEAFIPVFHRWIKEHVLPELIDRRRQLRPRPAGPGRRAHRPRHRTTSWTRARGGSASCTTASAPASPPPSAWPISRGALCTRRPSWSRTPALAGKLRFATNELLFRINDRLAPNTDATFASVRAGARGAGQARLPGPVRARAHGRRQGALLGAPDERDKRSALRAPRARRRPARAGWVTHGLTRAASQRRATCSTRSARSASASAMDDATAIGPAGIAKQPAK